MAKINLYDIMNEINALKSHQMYMDLEAFRPVDYKEYIKMDLNKFEKFYKYNEVYYRSLSKLNAALKLNGIEKDVRTLKAMTEDEERISELWALKVVIVYARYWDAIGYWLVCDGHILTSQSLSVVRGNPYNSEFNMVIDGERVVFNRAKSVYKAFVSEGEVKLYHVDGFFGNCGVDNLFPRLEKE